MKKIILSLLLSVLLWFGSCCTATAQTDQIAQWDQITNSDQLIQNDDSDTGTFQPVTVSLSTTSSVALQFPISMASKSVVVQPLDGGTLVGTTGESVIVGPDGKLSFQFQAAGQPGVYRVLVISPDGAVDAAAGVAMVQFQVSAPN
jgi:hypothetical protein